MRSLAAVAYHDGRQILLEFMAATWQFIDRDCGGTFKRQFALLFGRPDVDDLEACKICVGWKQPRLLMEVVDGCKGDHVDRIFGRAIGGRIGKIDSGKVIDRTTERHGSCKDIDPLVDSVSADGLSPEDSTAGFLVENLQLHVGRPWKIRCVIGRLDNRRAVGDVLGVEVLFVQSSHSNG